MKKKSVGLMTMLSTLLMTAAILIASAWAADVNAETAVKKDLAESYEGKTVVIQTNDVHGAFEGYQYVAGLRDELESRGADVVLVDSGDYMQGSIYAAEDKGSTAAALMSACGYDYASLGNHEFDYGTARLRENLAGASYMTLCANLVNDADGSPSFPGSDLYKDTDSDLKIGFYGLLTSETLTSSTPGNVSGMRFLGMDELNGRLCDEINSLEADGADVIIGLTHLGTKTAESPELSTDIYNSTKAEIGSGQLAEEAVKKKYILLDAHNHSIMTKADGGEPVMSTGTKLMNAGIVVIDEASEEIEDHFLYQLRVSDSESAAFKEGLTSDEEIADAAKSFIDSINEKYGERFAESRVWLNGNKEKTEKDGETVRGNRDGETNLGDLVTDAVMWYARNISGDDGEYADKTIAIINGGGIRAGIEPGDITRRNILDVFPFGNTICLVYIKGSTLLEVLESATSAAPAAGGGFPQISGMDIVLDESAEYIKAGETYPGTTFYPPAGINRVTIKSVNGKPFDEDETYMVATNNFCAAGGDVYHAFADGSENVTDTGITDEYVVQRYITEALGGVIGEEYKDPQGRITITHDAADAAREETEKAVINANSVIAQGDYKSESTAAVREAVSEALLVMDDPLASASEIEEAAAKISAALRQLEPTDKEAEKENAAYSSAYNALAANIIKANKEVNEADYKADGYAKYAAALAEAKAALKNDASDSAVLESANRKLLSAWGELEKKDAQPMKVKALKKKIRSSSVRKKAKSVKALKVSGAAGTVTYKKLSGSKQLSINKKTGKIRIKKGTRKGSYRIKVRVKASGDGNSAAGSKTVTLRVRVY